MAFRKNADYTLSIGVLTMISLTLPFVSTENIDCTGKAFHCVNSTHFKICVDFGGGVSKTVDDFLIPCPTNTACRDTNTFECEHQVTTTLAPISPSDVTNEQAELSVISDWGKVDVTTLFPEHKTNKTEELITYDSNVYTTEFSSSLVSSNTTDYISSTTLDDILNQVSLSSENNIQNTKTSDLSESVTVSYAPAPNFGLVSYDDEFLIQQNTTTAKVTVKDTLINVALHTNTTNNRDDLSLVPTVQILEGVTERNISLVESVNSSNVNVTNNNEYDNTNNTMTLSTLVTQINSLSTPSEIFESTTPYSVESFSISKDPRNYSNILSTTSNLNIDNATNDSSINLLNSATTTVTYNLDREQNTKSDSSPSLNLIDNYESLSMGTELEPFNSVKLNFTVGNTFDVIDDVTTPTNTQIYVSTENILSNTLTNVFYTDNKTNHDTNRTETLFTLFSITTEFPYTTSVKETFDYPNENFTIESSTISSSVDNLITPTTHNNYQPSFEKIVTSAINNTDLYSINTYQINDSTDLSPISDKPYVGNLTESNPTSPYINLLSEVLFNSTSTTIRSFTNNLLKSNSSSDRLSLDRLDLNNTENNAQKITNDTNFVENKTTIVIENTDVSVTTTLFVESNDITIPTQLNSVPMLDTSTPLVNLHPLNIDIDLNSRTTLQDEPLPEHYQSIITVNPEAYQNQENRYSFNTSQTSEVKENEIVPTTIVYSSQNVMNKTIDDFSYLANKNNSFKNITNIKVSDALLSISNKKYDNLNIYSSPVIASTETISIYPFTKALKESSKTYLNETTLRASNVTNKDNMLYTIKEQVQTPTSQPVIEDILPTTQINGEYEVFNVSLNKLNAIVNNSFTNNDLITKTTLPILKQELVRSKSYENKKIKMDIITNEIITTTESVTFVVNSNLNLTGHVESTKTYSETHTQSILDTTTIFHNENSSNIDNNLLSIHYNTSKNISKIQDFSIGNKERMLESDATINSSSLVKKKTSVHFENIFEVETLDLASYKNIAQTTSHATISDRNSSDTLSTKSSYVNVNNKQIVTTINNNKANNKTTTIFNNASNDNDFLTLSIKLPASFEVSENFKSSFKNTALKFNSTLLLKQHLTNSSNETLIKLLETDANRNASSNKYDNFLKKDRLQDTYYKNNIKKQLMPIPTTTVESILTELIPKTPHLTNQTTLLTAQFTCRDSGKYSDKDNCNKFYICIGKLQPIIGMCPADTVFSEIKKQCTKNLSHCIRNNQFRCLSSGRFIDVLSGEYYYVCVKKLDGYVRFKLQCQKGYHLNKENIQCSLGTTSTENVSKTMSDTSTNEKKSKEIKNSQKYEIQFECDKEGKFEHPDDCRKYFVCTKSSKSKFRRKIKKCDSDEVFNKEKRKCVDSGSYEC